MIPDFRAASQIRDVHDTNINSNSIVMIIISSEFSMKRNGRKEADFSNVILSLQRCHRRRSFLPFYRVFYARVEIDGNPYVGWSLNIFPLAIFAKENMEIPYCVIYYVSACQGSVIFP